MVMTGISTIHDGILWKGIFLVWNGFQFLAGIIVVDLPLPVNVPEIVCF